MLKSGLPVQLVVADRPCRALDIGRAAGVPAVLIGRHDFGYRPGADWDRVGFTATLAAELERAQINLIAMAGFMTVLAPAIFDQFPSRILNTHPSLLPDFRGGHAVADALAAGAKVTGCTVHIATAELDSGPILAQEQVLVHPGDTAGTLQERIKVVERRLYPQTIREYLAKL